MKSYKEKRVKSVVPVYLLAGAVLLCALIFPIYKLWALGVAVVVELAIYLVARRLFPDKTEYIEGEVEYNTGDPELDIALKDANGLLESLEQLNPQIPDETVSAAINSMVLAGYAILEEISVRTEKARSVRGFLAYYLPMSVKLMAAYAKQVRTSFSGENIDMIKSRIEENSTLIAKAFEHQLDKLYEGEFLDISTDITVLEGMLKRDGVNQ